MKDFIIQALLNAGTKKNNSGSTGGSSDQPESDWTIVHFLFDATAVNVNAISFKDKESSKFYYVRSCNISSVTLASGYKFACPYGFANLEDFIVYGSSDAENKLPVLAGTDEINFDTKDSDGHPLMLLISSLGARPADYFEEAKYVFSVSYNNPSSISGSNWYANKMESWLSIEEITRPDGTISSGSFAVITAAINLPASKLDYLTLHVDYRSQWDRTPNWMLIQDQSSNIKDLYNNWKQNHVYKTDFSKDHLITSGRSFPFFYSATENNGISFI